MQEPNKTNLLLIVNDTISLRCLIQTSGHHLCVSLISLIPHTKPWADLLVCLENTSQIFHSLPFLYCNPSQALPPSLIWVTIMSLLSSLHFCVSSSLLSSQRYSEKVVRSCRSSAQKSTTLCKKTNQINNPLKKKKRSTLLL
jgi:hypothetical protein